MTNETTRTYVDSLQLFWQIVQEEPTLFMFYPLFVAALETTWEFADALFISDLGNLAFWMQREVTRLALWLPWIYALDHLYKYASLAWRIGLFDEAQSILSYLKEGEQKLNVTSWRSEILTARFISDPTKSNQELEKLERSYNKRGLMVCRDEARNLGRLSSSGYPVQKKRLQGDFIPSFTFSPWFALANAQNQLKLASFASSQALLPKKPPW